MGAKGTNECLRVNSYHGRYRTPETFFSNLPYLSLLFPVILKNYLNQLFDRTNIRFIKISLIKFL